MQKTSHPKPDGTWSGTFWSMGRLRQSRGGYVNFRLVPDVYWPRAQPLPFAFAGAGPAHEAGSAKVGGDRRETLGKHLLRARQDLARSKVSHDCGCGSMVECGLPKPETRVRFPSPAPLQTLIKPLISLAIVAFCRAEQSRAILGSPAQFFPLFIPFFGPAFLCSTRAESVLAPGVIENFPPARFDLVSGGLPFGEGRIENWKADNPGALTARATETEKGKGKPG